MAWYHMTGQDQDVVLYTDVRLVRNLHAYPFTHRLDAAGAKEIITSVGGVLEENGFCKIDFADISRTEAYSLVERQYATLGFVKESLPHALYLNEPCSMSAMLCEENHISLQCILAGRALSEAYASVNRVEGQLDERFNIAFAEGLGYLSPSPLNTGSGLQISTLLCLPSMTEAGQIDRLIKGLSEIGVGLRAILDEKGHNVGSLFYMSYRPQFHQGEASALAFVEGILSTIISEERSVQHASVSPAAEQRADRIMRAIGTLHHALLIQVPELLNLLADVRLGIRIGVVNNVNMEALTALMIEALPATLSLASASAAATSQADAAMRATYARERMRSASCVSV